MMFKTLFFTFLLFTTYNADAAVTAKYLTVASVALDDGKTRLLFDPAWTRPGVLHVMGFKPLVSDEELVTKILKKNDLEKVDAVFASHSHFDHVIDAPIVSKVAGATFYTDESSERLAKAYKDPKIKTVRMTPYQKIKIGDFTVTPMEREHSKILHLFYFLPGPVPENTDLSFWDYHVGNTWFYLVEHPEGTIVVDQGSNPFVDTLKKYTTKVDALIQGVANRKDDDVILNGYVKLFRPKIFVPVHFDNFFIDFNDGGESSLPGVKLEDVLGKLKKAYPTMKVDKPLYGKPITILEVER